MRRRSSSPPYPRSRRSSGRRRSRRTWAVGGRSGTASRRRGRTACPLRFVGRPWRASPSEGYPDRAPDRAGQDRARRSASRAIERRPSPARALAAGVARDAAPWPSRRAAARACVISRRRRCGRQTPPDVVRGQRDAEGADPAWEESGRPILAGARHLPRGRGDERIPRRLQGVPARDERRRCSVRSSEVTTRVSVSGGRASGTGRARRGGAYPIAAPTAGTSTATRSTPPISA